MSIAQSGISRMTTLAGEGLNEVCNGWSGWRR